MRPRAPRWGFLVTVLLLAGGAYAQEDATRSSDLARGLFREGLKLYDEGRYKEAYEKLEEVLAQRPSADLALEMRNEAGHQFFVELLSRDENLAGVARQLLKLAEQGRHKERQSPERIHELLRDLESKEFEVQFRARESLVNTVGQYVVPYVVEPLRDKRNNEYRVRVIDLLVALGGEAVLPVIEILKSEDPFLRQNACVVLGHIGDRRAAPALLRVREYGSESPQVRDEAGTALQRVQGQATGSAKDAYLQQAERYYQDDPLLIRNIYKEWTIWDWQKTEDGEKLVPREVPHYTYNEELAEKDCYDGLTVDADYEPLWTLLLSVHYAQLEEITRIVDVARARQRAGDLDAAAVTELETAQAARKRLEALNATRGARLHYLVLDKAMTDQRPEVGVAAIHGLRDMGDDGRLLPGARRGAPPERAPARAPARRPAQPEEASKPEPAAPQPARAPLMPSGPGLALIKALEDSQDKRVRYAAAELLALMNPPFPLAAGDRVIETLTQALGEVAPRVALVIENDVNIRNHIVGLFKAMNYMALGAENGRKGLARARDFPAEDVIVLSSELTIRDAEDLSPYAIVDALKADYRTKDAKIIILTDRNKRGVVEGNYKNQVDGVIGDDVDRTMLANLLDTFFAEQRYQEDAKARSVEIAAVAARALESIDPDHTYFKPQAAIPALGKSVELHPDAVRIPAMGALGRLRAKEEAHRLVTVYANKQNSKAARLAALEALAPINRAHPDVGTLVFTTLRGTKEDQLGLFDPEMELRAAAGRALGNAGLTSQQYQKIFEEQREK